MKNEENPKKMKEKLLSRPYILRFLVTLLSLLIVFYRFFRNFALNKE